MKTIIKLFLGIFLALILFISFSVSRSISILNAQSCPANGYGECGDWVKNLDTNQYECQNAGGGFTTQCAIVGGQCKDVSGKRFCNGIGQCLISNPCTGGGGGGGGGCICGKTVTTECKKDCQANGTGALCGYTAKGAPKHLCTQTFCNACPSCNTTAPSNVSVSTVSPTKATVTWTPGANGVSQSIYAGTDKTEVEQNCPSGIGAGKSCVIADVGLTATQTSYTSGDVLSPGTLYYFRIVTYKDSGCSSNSTTLRAVSSCFLSPASATMTVGDNLTFTESVNSSTEIQRVDFSASGGNVSLSPTSDTSYTYQTSALALTPTSPDVTLTGSVYLTGEANPTCSSTSSVVVVPPGPWWQVKDMEFPS